MATSMVDRCIVYFLLAIAVCSFLVTGPFKSLLKNETKIETTMVLQKGLKLKEKHTLKL